MKSSVSPEGIGYFSCIRDITTSGEEVDRSGTLSESLLDMVSIWRRSLDGVDIGFCYKDERTADGDAAEIEISGWRSNFALHARDLVEILNEPRCLLGNRLIRELRRVPIAELHELREDNRREQRILADYFELRGKVTEAFRSNDRWLPDRCDERRDGAPISRYEQVLGNDEINAGGHVAVQVTAGVGNDPVSSVGPSGSNEVSRPIPVVRDPYDKRAVRQLINLLARPQESNVDL